MLAFTLRRAIQAIGVMIAVGIISFSMFRFAGDPVNQIVSLDTSAAERAEVRKSLGLDDPVALQFVRYLGNAVQFKFGVSYQFRQPVASLLAERMPATLELAICATIWDGVRHIDGGLFGAATGHRVCQISRRCRWIESAADLPDRDSPDPPVRRIWAGCRRSAAATWCGSAGGPPGCSRSPASVLIMPRSRPACSR
jgi:ABC-type microcin C transport system permease subunit YejB